MDIPIIFQRYWNYPPDRLEFNDFIPEIVHHAWKVKYLILNSIIFPDYPHLSVELKNTNYTTSLFLCAVSRSLYYSKIDSRQKTSEMTCGVVNSIFNIALFKIWLSLSCSLVDAANLLCRFIWLLILAWFHAQGVAYHSFWRKYKADL